MLLVVRLPVLFRGFNVFLLRTLIAAIQEDDHLGSVVATVDAILWANIDLQFVHAFTNDQSLLDVYHTDIRRARAATLSMIPTKTGAASALGIVLPELKGKCDGFAMRVPVANVSVVDFTFQSARVTSVEEINRAIKEAAENTLKGVLVYNTEPLVSIDFNHNPASSIFDATQTKVIGNTVKVLSWYDNEWGFSNRMLDVTDAWMKA